MDAIYTRVSTEEQERSGYSLASQFAACEKRLLSMGHNNIKLYEDGGFSGEFLDRPKLTALRSDLRAGIIQNICIYDPDRLSRNLTNQLLIADEIESAHVNLLFCTGDYDASPEGKLFFQMRGAISAFEKAKIRERTSRGRKQKGLSGKIVIPGKPYGYDFDKKTSQYIINEVEAKIVRMIYDMYVNQQLGGARAITTELAHLGIKGRQPNKPLSLTCVERILKRDIYYGQHYIFRQSTTKTGQNTRTITDIPREEWLPITTPAIISHELWLQAQKQCVKNKKYSSRNTTHQYLLQRIVCCALCGRGMAAFQRPCTRKSGRIQTYSYYHCITQESGNYALKKDNCQCRNIPAPKFDEMIWNVLIDIANGTNSLNNYLQSHNRTDYSQSIQTLTLRQQEIKKKQSDITKWYHDNIIDASTAEQTLKIINKELTRIVSSLNDMIVAQNKTNNVVSLDARTLVNAKVFEEKRKIIVACGLTIYAVRQNEHIQFHFKLRKDNR